MQLPRKFGTPGKPPSGHVAVACFLGLCIAALPGRPSGRHGLPLLLLKLVEAGSSMVAGAVGGLVFGFFGAGSRSDWHAAGRFLHAVPAPALSLSIRPAAKAAGEVAAGGFEAAGMGADCSGMVTDCSEVGADCPAS